MKKKQHKIKWKKINCKSSKNKRKNRTKTIESKTKIIIKLKKIENMQKNSHLELELVLDL